MRKLKIKKYLIVGFTLIILITGALGFNKFFIAEPVQSAPSDNVSGWAWSENIGWISFNGSNYGVNIDTNNGKFSGYAWSENIGWISFNESDLSGCPQAPCNLMANPSSQLGISNVNVLGWARALAYGNGWDGWIRFDHGKADEVYIDSIGDFYGYAWGGDVVGWTSLNGSNYKVRLNLGGGSNKPEVQNPAFLPVDWCGGPPKYYFSWTYFDLDGDAQTRYDFQILEGGSPVVSRTDSISPFPNTEEIIVAISLSNPDIHYNRTYSWQVKVYDGTLDSGWVSGGIFNTESHHYPVPDFIWAPDPPVVGEGVQFTDQTTFYGAIGTAWSWTFPDANPGTSGIQSPVTTFLNSIPSNKQVILKATDSDGYFCSIPKTVNVGGEVLPEWREVKPR